MKILIKKLLREGLIKENLLNLMIGAIRSYRKHYDDNNAVKKKKKVIMKLKNKL